MNLVAALEGTRALSFLRFFRFASLWTKELRYDLRVFSSSYEVTENLERIPLANGETVHSGIYFKRLTDYLNSVRDRFPDYAELLVLDLHGHVVATSAPQPRPVPLPPDWVSELTKNDWALGAPYWDSTATHAEMLVSVPIESARRAGRGAGGMHLLGALASRVNLHAVADTLKRFVPGESGQIYLMTRTGRLIVSSAGTSRELMRQGYARDAANWLLAREGRAIQFSSFTGNRVVGSVRVVPALNWVVVAEIPSSEAFSQVARLRNVTLGIVTLLLAVVGALAYLLSLLIVRPLDRLTQAAATVAKGDLDVGLPVTTGGEVGYLTEVFNNMVARLRESRTELEGPTEYAERIRKKLAKEKLPAGRITLSLGVSAFPIHGDTPDQLVAEADAALYLAKRAGGDRVVPAARPKIRAT